MPNQLENLKNLLSQYGQQVNAEKTVVEVHSTACLDNNVPPSAGVYWIETTMPIETMRNAISEVLGKDKRIRKTPPQVTVTGSGLSFCPPAEV